MFYKAAYLAQVLEYYLFIFLKAGEERSLFNMDKDSKTIDIVYEDIQVIDFTYLVGQDDMYKVLKPAVVEEKLLNQ